MNSRSTRNVFLDIYKNLLNNIRIIFLVGIFVGMLFAAYHIIMNNIIYNDYEIVYKVELKAKAYFSSLTSTLTKEECTSILYRDNVKNTLINYLGSQDEYENCIKDIYFTIDEDTILINYSGDSEENVKGTVSEVYYQVLTSLRDDGIINNMEIQGEVKPERIRQKIKVGLEIGITYMIEIGILLGMFLATLFFTIGYLIRGNVKDEIDVYKYFNLPVLSNIPPIDENVITQVPSQNDECL